PRSDRAGFGNGPSPLKDRAPPPHGPVSREETKSRLGTDSRVARFGPTTPTHLRGSPLALWRPERLDAAVPRSLLNPGHPRPMNAYPTAIPDRRRPPARRPTESAVRQARAAPTTQTAGRPAEIRGAEVGS